MKKTFVGLNFLIIFADMKQLRNIFFVVLAVLMVGCGTTSTVPITGRKQSIIVSDQEMLSLSEQQYRSYLKTAKLSTNQANTAMVNRVAQNIANAVTTYLKSNGLSSELQNFQWEFHLVQDKNVNAWCMPGGKIVVFEGLLPVTQNEASLAIVLGHEVAHAVAKHSAEKLSSAYRQQYGMQIAGQLLQGVNMSEGTQQLIALGASMGSQLLTAGFSRKMESEADHLGLIFAAMAGYNPQVATTFWERMAQVGAGSSSLFSDHPSDAKRLKDIAGWMPEALKYYKPKTNQTAVVKKMVSAGKTTTKTTKRK